MYPLIGIFTFKWPKKGFTYFFLFSECGKRAERFEANNNNARNGAKIVNGKISQLGAWPWYAGIYVEFDEWSQYYNSYDYQYYYNYWYESGDNAE